MKRTLKTIGGVILTLVILFGIFLIYSTLADYKPEPIEQLSTADGQVIMTSDTLNIFDWNIGYCGLGDDMSFFYDGGEKMRTTEQRTLENLQGIINQLKAADSTDLYFIQEVDVKSHRSYKVNEYQDISKSLLDYHPFLAYNYQVDFVPVPPTNPMGTVSGGLAIFSRILPYDVKRYSFPGNYAWPKGLFLLDRCFMVLRFNTSDGKNLVLINTHNSAYDDGSLRKKQMAMLKIFLLDEYKKGNYVLVGGDWNQNPPVAGQASSESKEKHLTRMQVASDFMPEGWQWVYDTTIPSNRMIDKPYDAATTITTVIDFFLLSPNLNPVTIKTLDLEFKNSDHEPVLFSFSFKPMN